ncbi:MAG: DUF2442 domain-containing protein [Brachymonas sp.]|nr:DUF2442 domain-containing protein [Brachymonas sp.]
MSKPLPKIKTAQVADAHSLQIIFDNGEHRLLDVSQFMDKGVFTALNEQRVFNAVKSMGYFLQWPGEIDLSADTAYLCSTAQKHENA